MGHDDVLGIKRTCPGAVARAGAAVGSGGFALRRIVVVEAGIVFVAGFRIGAVVFAVFAGHRADPAGAVATGGRSAAAACSSGVSRKSAPG